MENDVRKFEYRNMNWHCCIDLYHDRIEQTWDFLGLNIDRGKRVFLWQELSPDLGYAKGRGKDPTKQLRLAAAGFIFTGISYSLLPSIWHFLAYLILAWAVVGLALGLRYLKGREWIQIFKVDGSLAFSLPVSNWSDETIAEFKCQFLEWLRSRG